MRKIALRGVDEGLRRAVDESARVGAEKTLEDWATVARDSGLSVRTVLRNGGPWREHRAPRQTDHATGDASQERTTEPAAAVSCEHDHIRVLLGPPRCADATAASSSATPGADRARPRLRFVDALAAFLAPPAGEKSVAQRIGRLIAWLSSSAASWSAA